MTENEQTELVQTVERQIASLLADLEKRTGCYVNVLQFQDIEVTHVASPAPEYIRQALRGCCAAQPHRERD